MQLGYFLKIGFDAKRAFHNDSGLGNYSRTLLEGISQFYPNLQCILFNPRKSQRDWGKDFQVVMPEFPYSLLPSAIWRSWGVSREKFFAQLDIYHGLSHELPWGIENFSGKLVVTIHDLIFLKEVDSFPLIDRITYKKKILYACRVADKIIAISQQTKRDLVNLLGVDESKISVIYQSCSPLYYDNAQEYEKKSNLLLYVGAFRQRKNVLNIIRAFAQVAERIKDYRLILAGSGRADYLDKMHSLITSLHLNERVIITERPTQLELRQLYRDAKLFIYPSRYEGFGIPILESLFSGTPVIAATGSCLEETGGDGALYVHSEDTSQLGKYIVDILQNRELWQQLVIRGLGHCEQFRLENTTRNLVEFYQSL